MTPLVRAGVARSGAAAGGGGGGSAPSTNWTPANITTQLWFDANDAGTITIGTGVSQWNDKSGNARHVSQSTGANQPAYNSVQLNSKPVLSFDGSNDVLRRTGGVTGLFQNIGTATVYIVQRQTVTPVVDGTSDVSFSISDNGTAEARIAMYTVPVPPETAPNRLRALGCRLDADAVSQIGNPIKNMAINTWEVIDLPLDYTNGDGFCYVNGTQVAATLTFTSNGSTSNTAPSTLNLGSYVDGLQLLTGNIAEFVVTHNFDSLERYLMEGYLAWKWGQQANLATFHPFTAATPDQTVYPFWDFYTQTAGHITVDNEAFSATRGSLNDANFRSIRGPFGKSAGQWYWEYKINTGPTVTGEIVLGAAQSSMTSNGYPGNDANGRGIQSRPTTNPLQYTNGASSGVNGTGTNYVTNDIVGIALDFPNSQIKFYVNNVLIHTWSSIPAGTWYPAVGLYNNTRKVTLQRTLTYTPPSGFSQLVGP